MRELEFEGKTADSLKNESLRYLPFTIRAIQILFS
jgi:hypothetical protein